MQTLVTAQDLRRNLKKCEDKYPERRVSLPEIRAYLAAHKKPVVIIKFSEAELGEFVQVVASSAVEEALEDLPFGTFNTRQVETSKMAEVDSEAARGRTQSVETMADVIRGGNFKGAPAMQITSHTEASAKAAFESQGGPYDKGKGSAGTKGAYMQRAGAKQGSTVSDKYATYRETPEAADSIKYSADISVQPTRPLEAQANIRNSAADPSKPGRSKPKAVEAPANMQRHLHIKRGSLDLTLQYDTASNVPQFKARSGSIPTDISPLRSVMHGSSGYESESSRRGVVSPSSSTGASLNSQLSPKSPMLYRGKDPRKVSQEAFFPSVKAHSHVGKGGYTSLPVPTKRSPKLPELKRR
jgi:hypothetical protein